MIWMICKLSHKVNVVMMAISQVLVAFILIYVAASIFTRFLRISLLGVYELTPFAFMIAILFSLAYSEEKGEHLGMGGFCGRLPKTAGKVVETTRDIMVTGLLVVMVVISANGVIETFAVGSRSMDLLLPLGFLQLALPLGFFFFLVAFCVRHWIRRRG